MDIIIDRKKNDIFTMSVATQSDPKELQKLLFKENAIASTKLDTNALDRLKGKLGKRSKFGVK